MSKCLFEYHDMYRSKIFRKKDSDPEYEYKDNAYICERKLHHEGDHVKEKIGPQFADKIFWTTLFPISGNYTYIKWSNEQ